MRIAGLVLTALLSAGSARAQEPAEQTALARALVVRLADRIGASFIVRGEGALTEAVRSALGDRLAPVGASTTCPPGYPSGHGGTWAITIYGPRVDADSAIVAVGYNCRTQNRRMPNFGMTEDIVFRRGASGWIFLRRDMTRIT
jgi:hypothetical protein